jgi:hypothetical protein
MEPQIATSGSPTSSGNAVIGFNGPTGDGAPHPKWEWATTRIRQRRELCDQRALAHDARAVFWQRWAAPLTWLTAVLAAMTSLSVVANLSFAATALSIVTAVVAATVAAFQPSESAKSHRAAATAYERLARKLDDAEALDFGEGKQQIPADKIEAIRTEIARLEEELNAIELSHPPVSGFNHHAEVKPMELGHSPITNFRHHIATR